MHQMPLHSVLQAAVLRPLFCTDKNVYNLLHIFSFSSSHFSIYLVLIIVLEIIYIFNRPEWKNLPFYLQKNMPPILGWHSGRTKT